MGGRGRGAELSRAGRPGGVGCRCSASQGAPRRRGGGRVRSLPWCCSWRFSSRQPQRRHTCRPAAAGRPPPAPLHELLRHLVRRRDTRLDRRPGLRRVGDAHGRRRHHRHHRRRSHLDQPGPGDDGDPERRQRPGHASRAWAVGDGGTILQTNNGGSNWNDQTSGTTVDLNDVVFVDIQHGWAVGQNGTIRVTANGRGHLERPGLRHHRRTRRATSPTHRTDGSWPSGGPARQPSSIIATSDGGDHWTTQLAGVEDEITACRSPTRPTAGP